MKIYGVTNKVNGKVYIGQTAQSLSKRRRGHEKIANDFSRRKVTSFIWALREYGTASFSWEVLCGCDSPEELNANERMYVEFFNSNNPDLGYDSTDGASGGSGARSTLSGSRPSSDR